MNDKNLPVGEHVWNEDLKCWCRIVRDPKDGPIEKQKLALLERLLRSRIKETLLTN